MSTYEHTLPQVFSTAMKLDDKDEAREIISWLLDAGTSFALTMDRPYTLWVSQASLDVIAGRTGL